jgi:cbb3-type cytochrome oxidase subunit 3
MRISDVVSSLGLAIYPIIALLLFLSVFVGVTLRVMNRARRAELDDAALLPLAEEEAGASVSEVHP